VQPLADVQGAGVFGGKITEVPVADGAAEVHALLLAVEFIDGFLQPERGL